MLTRYAPRIGPAAHGPTSTLKHQPRARARVSGGSTAHARYCCTRTHQTVPTIRGGPPGDHGIACTGPTATQISTRKTRRKRGPTVHAAEATQTAHELQDDDPPRPGVNLGRTPGECAVWGAEMAPAPVGLPSGAVVDALESMMRQSRDPMRCAHYTCRTPSQRSQHARIKRARARPLSLTGSRTSTASRQSAATQSRAFALAREGGCQRT